MGIRIGRNAPCPCGSGLKFKNCCSRQPPPRFPRSSLEQLKGDPQFGPVLEAMRYAGEPQGEPVPSVEHKGRRFRIVRNRLYWRPLKETFHEFLLKLLQWTLGEAWFKKQLKIPFEQRHQILKWYKAASDHMKSVVGNPLYREGEVYGAAPTGDVQSLIVLAYDVYHLLHRGELPEDLLQRLKDQGAFQGARYEVAVAATFIRARCKVKFISENIKKHCEFIAKDPLTSATIAVEAKSRHRPGVLQFPGELDESRAVRGDVEELINKALEKDPGNSPFMIFVDLNVPLISGIPVTERAWFQDVWTFMQSLQTPTPEHPDGFNAILLTNFSYHWQGTQIASGGEYVSISSKYSRHSLPSEFLGRIIATERTTALYVASILNRVLEELLHSFFVDDTKLTNKLLSGLGPLANFFRTH